MNNIKVTVIIFRLQDL